LHIYLALTIYAAFY